MRYPRRVRYCHVQMKGKDEHTHSLTVEASSVFDAAQKAVEQWARLWWFSDAPLLIQSSD